MPYFHQLKKTLGDDFESVMNCNEDDEPDQWDDDVDGLSERLTADGLKRAMDNWQKMIDESNRHPSEIYSYQYPEYPKTLNVTHLTHWP